MTAEVLVSPVAGLRQRLAHAWDAQTASGPWLAERPSMGQCAVTALVVQDELGGDLLRGVVRGRSHYWNLIEGSEYDLTRDQFDAFALDGEAELRTRDSLLANQDTALRYRRLRARLRRPRAVALRVGSGAGDAPSGLFD